MLQLNQKISSVLENCVEYVNYFDIGMLIYELYKDTYVVTNIKQKSWFRFKDHIWNQTELGPYKELSTEVLTLFKQYMRSLKKSVKKNAGTIQNCEKIISMLFSTSEKEQICRECLYIFYDYTFFKKLDHSNSLVPFKNGVYNWQEKTFRDGRSNDMLSIYVNEEFVPDKCYDKLIKDFIQFRTKLINTRIQSFECGYNVKR